MQHGRLPEDFDPVGYLELNPDVRAAGVDAAQHYLKHGQREGRRYSDLRRKKLLEGLDVENLQGVEIGALCRPFVRTADGPITYVDYLDTESLRSFYANDPHVDVERIVNVDVVWRGEPLRNAFGDRKVDYVVASHVIEHVPDMVTWLQDIRSIISQEGEIRLIIPDKRYTFDYFRRESRLSDVLLSYTVKAKVPQPHCVLDFALNAADVNAAVAWERSISRDECRRWYSFEGAIDIARDAFLNGTYHDVHCWAFTPASFSSIMLDLAKHGLTDLACRKMITTEEGSDEFFVHLQPSSHPETSWQNILLPGI